MSIFKSKITDYYSNLINTIDINAELLISRCISLNQQHKILEKINTDRAVFISMIKKCEAENLSKEILQTTSLFDGCFCFYLKPKNFFQSLSLGKLVLTNQHISEAIINRLKDPTVTNIKFNFKEQFKLEILKKFISSKSQSLIDLRECENNNTKEIDITYDSSLIEPNSLNEIDSLINLKTLKKMSIELRKCTRIESTLFFKLNKLEKLTIKCPKLRYLQENNFSHLTGLKYLCLKSYQNFEIEQNAFYGLELMEKLDLSGNSLELESALQLNGLDNLVYLNISTNHLHTLSFKPFFYLNFLKILDISDSCIEVIEPGDLDGLDRLEQLYFRHNCFLQACKKIELRKNSLKNLFNLKVLNLENEYVKVAAGSLKNLTDLRYLNLRGIRSVELSQLGVSKTLEFLDITPKFNVFSDYETFNLPNLKYLRFGCQVLSKLNCPNLQALDVNDLYQIKAGFFDNLNNLDFLRLNFVDDSILNELDISFFSNLSNKFKFFEINFYRPLPGSLDKLKQKSTIFNFLFENTNAVYETKIDFNQRSDTLTLTITCLESEDFYFENLLNVSSFVNQAYIKQKHYDEFFSAIYDF
ncbi:unnamed protein product [Brachionus calyciflorus]|uniref:Uncharacterized protein n=1 Tax=Brachionus calyciflorus TaxID=104777 RepID=A0A814KJD7_9BILA|nr:unnamed protein product [Brachionus calyciflorus]